MESKTRKFESIAKCKSEILSCLPIVESINVSVGRWYHDPTTSLILTRRNKIITFYLDGKELKNDTKEKLNDKK